MNKTVLMCVQPAIRYYSWQIEVMLHNFIDLQVDKHFEIHLLFAYNVNEKEHKANLDRIFLLDDHFSKYYPDAVKFYYYNDTREYPISYISSIRPNALKQHFKEFPELSERVIFYHDCDIVFTKFPDFLLKYNNLGKDWYVSDTISYIGHNYILSKGENVLNQMTEIVGIDKELVKSKEHQSGGAQYILNGVDYEFWDKVEKDAEKLYKDITALNNQLKAANPTYHEVQIWCADMWAVLWNAWLKGYDTHIVEELSFCWATEPIKRWDDVYIFHNAGVTADLSKELFYKAEYRVHLPYGIKDTFNKEKASYKYFEQLEKVSQKTCLAKMSKIKEILLAYATMVNPTEEQKEIAEERLETCMGCDKWVDAVVSYCSECGCATKGKIFTPRGVAACPLAKWKN